MELSVVIPVKNEAENIGPLVAEIAAALERSAAYEIVCVDDGSGDGTAAEIARWAAHMPQLRLVRHRRSYGQSAAILTGVRAARGVWIATLDGDGQNDPADIPRLWRLARAAPADPPLLVAGNRAARRDSRTKRAASRVANRVRARLLGDATPDTGCGLKLIPRALFLALPQFDHMHRFLPALVLRAGGIVRSVPVNHRPRRAGVSKYGVLDRLWVGIVDLCGVWWLQRRTLRPQLRDERESESASQGPEGASSPLSPDRHPERAPLAFPSRPDRGEMGEKGWRRAARLAVLALLAAGIAAVWEWRTGLDPAAIGAAIAGWPAAPLVFIAAHVAASLLFVPRTVLAVAAGLLFGAGWGAVWATLGSTAGAVAGFCLARYVSAGLVDLDRHVRLRPVLDRVERGGWRAVALLRLIPVIPHSLANYALGLTRVRLGAFALGSLVGQLPMTIACVDLGAAGERLALGGAGWLAPSLIGAAALGLSLLVPAVARRRAG